MAATQILTPITQAIRFAAPACFSFALMSLVYGIVSAPTRQASRLGLRGLKRTRILSENEVWAGIEPLVRWLGVRVSGLPSDEQRAQLEKHIALAGDYMGLTADEYLALTIISGVGCGFLGAI